MYTAEAAALKLSESLQNHQHAISERDESGRTAVEAIVDLDTSCWNMMFEHLHQPSLFATPPASFKWHLQPHKTFFTSEVLVIDFSSFEASEYTLIGDVVRFLCSLERNEPVHLIMPAGMRGATFLPELGWW